MIAIPCLSLLLLATFCGHPTQILAYFSNDRQIFEKTVIRSWKAGRGDLGQVPVVYYLSGLTCTDENVTQKASAKQVLQPPVPPAAASLL